jgi:MFS family permease
MSDVARPPLGRRFVTVWAGQTLSAIGSVLSGIGVAVYVFLETGSTAWLGLLAALAAVPYVVTGPLLPVVDRFPRRTVMIAGDVLASVGSVIALVLAMAGRLEVWHLAAAGFVGGLGSSFQFPAFQAAVPLLVESDALGRANGLNQLGPAVGIVIGPVLATPLIAWWGIEAVLIADLATFAIAVVATLAVRFGTASPLVDDGADASATPDDGTWRTTWAWLRRTGRPLVVLLAAMAVVNFCLAFFNIALIALATDVAGAARAGLVLGAGGVTMIVGTLMVGHRGVPERRVRMFAFALALFGLGCAIAASRPAFGLLIVGVIVALAAVPAVNAAVATIFHERVPGSMQGRVFGLRSAIGRALEPVGSLVGGLTIAHIAVPAMTDGGAAAGSLGALLGTGPERGAAAVLLVTGLALVTLGVWLGRSWINGAIDGERAVATDGPTDPALGVTTT